MHNENVFSELFEEVFSKINIYEIKNFDYINYTPTDKTFYEFFEKWYFEGDEVAINIYKQPEANSEYKVSKYPIIDSALRTKIATYYYEKTKS